ncbi:hypothetical protein SteCoe_7929 [Stentor coeruleus]|uniref:Uncharacterized protein n=1 Tax=Stentor coeruleus TaxID=5963 RepID=A0A1R2CLG2_9CILI|nr:hypothetical protein SteCoe_7929 [Stentor coeruleus]
MHKYKSISPLQKRNEIPPVLSQKCSQTKRPNSTPHSSMNQTSKLTSKIPHNKTATTIKKPMSSDKSVTNRSKDNIIGKSLVNNNLKESAHLINALKTYLIEPTGELNSILIEIPKYSARRVQDLKKWYKPTENYDALATCFLIIFAEIDETINKELVSLRRKIGEVFTSYISNSGKLYRLIRSLPEILKKIDFCPKNIIEAQKSLEIVAKEHLSNIFQDLHELLRLIINFCMKNTKKNPISKLTSKGYKINDENFHETKDLFEDSRIFKTYNEISQSNNNTNMEISFIDLANKPLTCSNKNKNSINFSMTYIKEKSQLVKERNISCKRFMKAVPIAGSLGRTICTPLKAPRSVSQSALIRKMISKIVE